MFSITNICNVVYTLDKIMSEYESGTFRCTDCGKEFLTKREAEKHYKKTHSDEITHTME